MNVCLLHKVGDQESATLTDIGTKYETLGEPVIRRNHKKGVAIKTAQSCLALEPHKTSSWWYSWSVTDGFGTTYSHSKNKGSFCSPVDAVVNVDNARDAGMDFVPMFWRRIPERPFDEAVHINLEKSRYLLTFNEPEFEVQANLSPREVAEMWSEIVEIAGDFKLQIVAPCSESGGHGKTWYTGWKQECHNLYGDTGCEYDFICLHMYYHPYPCEDGVHDWACIGENASSASSALLTWYNTFGQKPIWVTEFACAPWGGADCTGDHHTDLMIQLGSLLEESPLVYRYAWFSLYDIHWTTNTLNELEWNGEKGVGCQSKKWKGAWGDASWQIQTMDECVAAAESDSDCNNPLSLSVDDDNCYCGTDDCSITESTYSAMTTYHKVGDSSTVSLTDIGLVYESLGTFHSFAIRTNSPTSVPPSGSPTGTDSSGPTSLSPKDTISPVGTSPPRDEPCNDADNPTSVPTPGSKISLKISQETSSASHEASFEAMARLLLSSILFLVF